eukprot:TRINITY_DN28804_c0_g1_i3.p1 TRINITY_DN28804_c0_g1~~TRINITY_DN28804_c0_g1_i3.p1  ORF type:complete len:242 (-),score=54.27 TRINITY_DN28804_c0_g1_i3:44-769(-)
MNSCRYEMAGAGGNCLFLSAAPQVAAAELTDLSSRSPAWEAELGADLGARWQDLQPRERAALLRRMAMLDEAEFLAELDGLLARGEQLPADVEWRTRELFTDMAEEFIGSNTTELAADIPGWDRMSLYSRVREVVSTWELERICKFVLLHGEEYMATTGREGNWAGSSEMAAMASALRRPVMAYGNNWVSQDEVQLLEVAPDQWELQPYFEAHVPGESRAEPILVFQTNGGGHYQMLRPAM